MFRRVGALALILSAATILQPSAAFAQERYEGRYHEREYRDRDGDRREWRGHEHREHERREWREHEWREEHRNRDYDRGWRYRGGRAYYFGVEPSYGYYEAAPAPYYPPYPYYER